MTICLLGNSLSALTLAKALVNQNIYVDVLCQKRVSTFSKSRTIGISKSNTDYINKHIVNIDKFLWKLNKIEILSDNLKNEKLLNFKNNNKQLFSIIRSHELYQVLEKDLLKNKFFRKKFINNKKFNFIENYELIINFDYLNIITKKFFSKKIVKKYNSFAYTTIIKHEKIINNTATQIFTRRGPLAFLPISNKETSVVFSVHNLISKKSENIEKLIKSYNFKYKINKIDKIDSIELKSLSLRSYFHRNILAFGDLLHKIHPLAGQGFNMTIRDIKLLVNLIKEKRELGLPLDASVCSEFENSSKYKNFIFSNGIDLIYEFFNIERKTKSKILTKSLQSLGKYSLMNKIFTKIADKGI